MDFEKEFWEDVSMFTHSWTLLPLNFHVLQNSITKGGRVKATLKWNPSSRLWASQERKQVPDSVIIGAQGEHGTRYS